MLRVIIVYLRFVPAVAAIGNVLADLDPIGYPLMKLVCRREGQSCSTSVVILMMVIRSVLLGIGFVELTRIVGFSFILLLYYAERKIYALYMMSRLPLSRDWLCGTTGLKWYRRIIVADRISNKGWCIIVGGAMAGGFSACVTVNVLALRCFSFRPILFYLALPVTSVVLLIMVIVLLSAVISGTTESSMLLKKMSLDSSNQSGAKQIVGGNMKRLSQKLVVCSRPFKVSCGTFYDITEDTKVTFLYDVFLRTVDGVMLPIFE